MHATKWNWGVYAPCRISDSDAKTMAELYGALIPHTNTDTISNSAALHIGGNAEADAKTDADTDSDAEAEAEADAADTDSDDSVDVPAPGPAFAGGRRATTLATQYYLNQLASGRDISFRRATRELAIQML